MKKTINGCFFEGDCIRFSNVVKNLGFKLDRFLSMEHQVDAIVSHCYKLICDVGQNRHLLSDKDTELLMQAMVSSRIDYCSALFIGVAREIIKSRSDGRRPSRSDFGSKYAPFARRRRITFLYCS